MHGMCFYQNDGTGRDLYISGNNGGFYKEYRIINTKPPVTSKSIHTKSLYNPVFTKPINRYVCDGQGRDVYIFSQNSRNCKPKSTNSPDLEAIVRNDEPDDSANSNEKSNPTMNSIDCVKNKRNKQIAESVLKRVFYANAENVPVRRMSPKVKFISRSTVLTPETSPLNERIKYKDRFQYYYPESRNKCGYVFTQEKLSRDIKSLATFNSRYDK